MAGVARAMIMGRQWPSEQKRRRRPHWSAHHDTEIHRESGKLATRRRKERPPQRRSFRGVLQESHSNIARLRRALKISSIGGVLK